MSSNPNLTESLDSLLAVGHLATRIAELEAAR